MYFKFQIKDDGKTARNSATQAYTQYVEEPKTSQRSQRLDTEFERFLHGPAAVSDDKGQHNH